VREWIEVNGYVCPGWGRDPHPSDRLTADHVIPVAAGGDEQGELGVLCGPCNSRKKDRVVDPRTVTSQPRGSRDWFGDRQW
jgi:5-methylcytosine-specific restriction enzyme A